MRKTARPNIAFAGLTAAGKTTHARILAAQLDYEWISATAILLDILGIGENPEKIWFSKFDSIQKAREDERVDIELERRLKELTNRRDGLILDTWAMAYIYEGPLIRIWIASDETSRTRKCFVSQGITKPRNLDECRQLIHEKDHTVRLQFKSRLKFDLFTDMGKYDAVLSNTDLIPEPTDECSKTGIKTFTPVVYDVVQYLLHQALGTAPSVSVQDLREKHGKTVQKVNEKPWSFFP